MRSDVTFSEFLDSRVISQTLVILGPQGSGTNLLVKILKSVFGIFPILDRSLIFDAAVKVHLNPSQSNIRRQLQYVLGKLHPSTFMSRFATKHYSRMGSRFEGIESWIDNLRVSTAVDFVRFFYCYADYVAGGKCNSIKSDDMWENIEYLNAVIPNPRLILLVRDPRDNVNSIINKNFGPCHVFSAANYTKKRLNTYSQFFKSNSHSGDLTVRYEDLLSEPKIFCEAFSKNYGFETLDSLDVGLERLTIHGGNFDKWRQIKKRHLQIVESVLRDEISEFNYEFSGAPFCQITSGERLRWNAIDCALRCPQKLDRILDSFLRRSK